MTVPVVIDCDPGVDDMVALLLACASPEIELLGVTTVGGNLGLATTTRNACAVLALAGRADLPVAPGASRTLVRVPPPRAGHPHGPDGLGGIRLPEPAGAPDPRHAIDLLAAMVEASDRPVTVVAIGPLTNVALFYARYPELADRLGRLIVMGGATGAGNITPAAEFNIWFDPEAAYRVLTEPPVPTTMVGLETTYAAALGRDDLTRLAAAGPVGALVGQALGHYLRSYAEVLGRDAVPVHDAVAVLAAIRPDLVELRPARIEVDTSSGPDRGATTVDQPDDGPVARVATGVDVAAFADLIVTRVGQTAPAG
ncbi:nucleoside hydrolase [Solwaraspora sp. WMMD1047]|uniref:nucleoside hydrolase n=1 Tax=Solwaraspora sp. WMMD1047 TaxID=3016102 RepID=UPI002416C28B|nr:nucleoside hydrolase [Solwaraspora sp. WMMD1047]MDG4830935.1 nucleoside hydrolase [Solwaraspora sp. WMMD1047]